MGNYFTTIKIQVFSLKGGGIFPMFYNSNLLIFQSELYEGRKASHNRFSSEPHSPHFLVRTTSKSLSFDHYVHIIILELRGFRGGSDQKMRTMWLGLEIFVAGLPPPALPNMFFYSLVLKFLNIIFNCKQLLVFYLCTLSCIK